MRVLSALFVIFGFGECLLTLGQIKNYMVNPKCRPEEFAMCVDMWHYQLCGTDRHPYGKVLACPKKHICKSDDPRICQNIFDSPVKLEKRDSFLPEDFTEKSPKCRYFEICNMIKPSEPLATPYPRNLPYEYINITECQYFSKCTTENKNSPDFTLLYVWKNPYYKSADLSRWKRMKRIQSLANIPKRTLDNFNLPTDTTRIESNSVLYYRMPKSLSRTTSFRSPVQDLKFQESMRDLVKMKMEDRYQDLRRTSTTGALHEYKESSRQEDRIPTKESNTDFREKKSSGLQIELPFPLIEKSSNLELSNEWNEHALKKTPSIVEISNMAKTRSYDDISYEQIRRLSVPNLKTPIMKTLKNLKKSIEITDIEEMNSYRNTQGIVYQEETTEYTVPTSRIYYIDAGGSLKRHESLDELRSSASKPSAHNLIAPDEVVFPILHQPEDEAPQLLTYSPGELYIENSDNAKYVEEKEQIVPKKQSSVYIRRPSVFGIIRDMEEEEDNFSSRIEETKYTQSGYTLDIPPPQLPAEKPSNKALKQPQQSLDAWLKPFLFRINSSMIQNNSIVLLILRNPPPNFSPKNPANGDQVINFYTVDAQLTSTNSKYNKRSAELRDHSVEEDNCNKNIRKFPKCRKPGKFPVMNTNCKEYIYCTRGNAKWFVDVFRCPDGYFFKPKLGHCTRDYLCKEVNICEGNGTVNLEDSQYICENGLKIELPECDWLTSGRVPIKDVGCQKYQVCTVVKGRKISKVFSCASSHYFDPLSLTCRPDYECQEKNICSFQFLGTSEPTTLPVFIPNSTEPLMEETTTLIPTTTIYNPEYMKCPANDIQIELPSCRKEGRYLLPHTGCKKYVECRLEDARIIMNLSECESNTFFNEITQSCEYDNLCKDDDLCFRKKTKYVYECDNGYSIHLPKCLWQTDKEWTMSVTGTGCKSYILCNQELFNKSQYSWEYAPFKIFPGILHECPEKMYYNDVLKKCDSKYICRDIDFCSFFKFRHNAQNMTLYKVL